MPSPLKSPTAIWKEPLAVGMLAGPPKLPAPFPRRIETLPVSWFAMARSCLPSPLKSPTATDRGLAAASKLVGAENVIGLQVAGVDTVRVNVFVVLAPPLVISRQEVSRVADSLHDVLSRLAVDGQLH